MVMLVTKGRGRTFVPFELNLYYYSWLNDQPWESGTMTMMRWENVCKFIHFTTDCYYYYCCGYSTTAELLSYCHSIQQKDSIVRGVQMGNFLLLLMGNGYYCHSKNECSIGAEERR